MGYFTERNGMRKSLEKTYDISLQSYYHLLERCKEYYINIAWKYPKECPDGKGCYDIDKERFYQSIKYEIPELYLNNHGEIDTPNRMPRDEYSIFAIFDLIEFMIDNIKDISHRKYHEYFMHYDLTFSKYNNAYKEFTNTINEVFENTGLLYRIGDDYNIERIVENDILTTKIIQVTQDIKENGLKELLNEAINVYKSPYYEINKNAVEKIWDALERLKTYYTDLDKKNSANQIVEDMSGGQAEFRELFEAEFKTLTTIGNNFRIRHHETNKTDILDTRHYDYFFNRCSSLIALAIQYLK